MRIIIFDSIVVLIGGKIVYGIIGSETPYSLPDGHYVGVCRQMIIIC